MDKTNKLYQVKKDERIVLTYVVGGVDTYVISYNSLKGLYYLYQVIGNELVKTAYKGKSPLELEKHFKEE